MEYLVEMDARDDDWQRQTSLMENGEEEFCYSGLLGKLEETKRPWKREKASLLMMVLRHMSPSFQPAGHGAERCKSQSTVSSILRNLITCRAVGTKDSVIQRGHDHDSIKNDSLTDVCLEICKVGKLGGSATRTSGDSSWNQSNNQTGRKKSSDNGEFTDLKSVPAAYRPVRFPSCSLCRKEFKPENLHSHMKSCRGMKMLTLKSAASASGEKASSWRSATSSDMVSDQTSLLCH